jgi:DNA-binding GntR family transcriptional regulator
MTLENLDLKSLESMGVIKIVDHKNGFVNTIDVKTPIGLVRVTRMNLESGIADKILEHATKNEMYKITKIVSDNIGLMIEDKEISEQIQTGQIKDFLVKLNIISGAVALVIQIGAINL